MRLAGRRLRVVVRLLELPWIGPLLCRMIARHLARTLRAERGAAPYRP
jgi:hypothetical protein